MAQVVAQKIEGGNTAYTGTVDQTTIKASVVKDFSAWTSSEKPTADGSLIITIN